MSARSAQATWSSPVTSSHPTPEQSEAFFAQRNSPNLTGAGLATVLWAAKQTRTFALPADLSVFAFGCNDQKVTESAACVDHPTASRSQRLPTYTGTYPPWAYIVPGRVMRVEHTPNAALRAGRSRQRGDLLPAARRGDRARRRRALARDRADPDGRVLRDDPQRLRDGDRRQHLLHRRRPAHPAARRVARARGRRRGAGALAVARARAAARARRDARPAARPARAPEPRRARGARHRLRAGGVVGHRRSRPTASRAGRATARRSSRRSTTSTTSRATRSATSARSTRRSRRGSTSPGGRRRSG